MRDKTREAIEKVDTTQEGLKEEFNRKQKEWAQRAASGEFDDRHQDMISKGLIVQKEIDPYRIETISAYLNVDSPEEQDNKIKTIIAHILKNYDELALEPVLKFISDTYGKKMTTLQSVTAKIAKPQKEIKLDLSIIKLNNYIDNVERFYNQNPFFYDKAGIWWFWNKQQFRYEMTDEVDLMNSLEVHFGFIGETVPGGIKNSYLEAFKRVGRLHHPKEAPLKWIQFKDKAFSLRSGKIYQVQPNFFFTNPIPFEIGTISDTPMLDKLFEEWVGKDDLVDLYEFIAYCCYRAYPIQLLFCLYGHGRNGKSTFIKILDKFLGTENTTTTELDAISGQNKSRFETFRFYRKLACFMGETNFNILSNSSILKKLVGGDKIGFEVKGKTPFDDYNYAKIVIASNSLPTSEDTSEGFYRRWHIIKFGNEFPEGKDISLNIPDAEFKALAKKVTEMTPRTTSSLRIDKGIITERLDKIKRDTGIRSDIEAIRYAITFTYQSMIRGKRG